MSIPNEYSVECEDCLTYNISPIKCESCWKKIIIKKTLEDVENIIDKLHNKYAGSGRLKVEVLKELKIEIEKQLGDISQSKSFQHQREKQ